MVFCVPLHFIHQHIQMKKLFWTILFLMSFIWVILAIRYLSWNHKSDDEGLSWFIVDSQTLEWQRTRGIEERISGERKQRQKEWEAIKVPDNSKYPQAEKKIIIWTWMIDNMMSYQNPGKTYKRTTKTENGETRKEAEETWYIYVYIYRDLWIKISTSLFYPPYFYEKTEIPIIERDGNIIYANSFGNGVITQDYIEVFFKDPKKSFEDEIRENQLPQWCTIQTGVADDHPMSKHIKWFQVIYISSMDGNLASDGICKMDKQLPSNPSPISFYMDPKKPDRYYKFSYGDCAPGPCSIFGDIEFF